jgi:hypothetical protein
MTQQMTIGQLATSAGVNVETVRYYQRRNLLAVPDLPAGGSGRFVAPPHSAASRISWLLSGRVQSRSRDQATCAHARVDQIGTIEPVQRGGVSIAVIGLPLRMRRRVRSKARGTGHLWLEPEPIEIVEERRLVLRPTAHAVVILKAQQHVPAISLRDSPHVHRVHQMSQVEQSSRCRRKSGPPRRLGQACA